jgi:hypothetical protein
MDAARLIANLVTVERSAGRIGDELARDFVIEAQDCVLRMQRENLELRRENHVLRMRLDSPLAEGSRADCAPAAAPFVFSATA